MLDTACCTKPVPVFGLRGVSSCAIRRPPQSLDHRAIPRCRRPCRQRCCPRACPTWTFAFITPVVQRLASPADHPGRLRRGNGEHRGRYGALLHDGSQGFFERVQSRQYGCFFEHLYTPGIVLLCTSPGGRSILDLPGTSSGPTRLVVRASHDPPVQYPDEPFLSISNPAH